MPTGYTCKVQDGRVTKLRDFALICARAFGATITMRDDSSDTPIPERFEPSDYHTKRTKEAEERFNWLKSLTHEQADQEAKALYEKRVLDQKASLERIAQESARYRKILTQIQRWQVPEELKNLKDFMTEQITSSLESDCETSYYGKIKPLTGDEWLLAEMKAVNEDIEYHTKEYAEEVKRVDGRNHWLAMLRASLPEETV